MELLHIRELVLQLPMHICLSYKQRSDQSLRDLVLSYYYSNLRSCKGSRVIPFITIDIARGLNAGWELLAIPK